MKFAIVVVMLGLAVAQASVSPWGYGGLPYPLLGGHGPVLAHGLAGPGPLLATGWGGHGLLAPQVPLWNPAAHIPAAVQVGPLGVHLGGHLGPVPSAVHVSALGHGHEGVYVAKTRGAVHTAPLAGHINSASSINLAPAPGTI